MTQPFTGLLAYPITPVTDDGEPKLGALAALVSNAAAAGVSAVTVLATSGAGVTFDRGERNAVVETAVEAVRAGERSGPRLPVYAAVSAASTREVVHLAKDAQRAGAGGLLLAPFAYVPLSDGEVSSLFASVAESTSLPICFYNKPLQTQYDLTPQTLAFLAENAHVVAVKETMRREDIAGRVQQLRDSVGLRAGVAQSPFRKPTGRRTGTPANRFPGIVEVAPCRRGAPCPCKLFGAPHGRAPGSLCHCHRR